LREGKEKTAAMMLGKLPETLATRGGRRQPGEKGASETDSLDGVEVTDLDSATRRQLNIPSNVHGVLVSNVEESSNAAEAGLRPRDIIMEINRHAVGNAEDAIELSEKAEGETILLRVWRGSGGRGGSFYLPVDNSKHK